MPLSERRIMRLSDPLNGLAARLEIAPRKILLDPAVDFVLSFAQEFARAPGDQADLKTAVSAALTMVFENNAGGKSEEPIALEISERQGKLLIGIWNRGVPILLNGGRRSGLNSGYFAKFCEASKHADRVSVENFGRRGQKVVLEIRLGAGAAARSLPADPSIMTVVPQEEKITLRPLSSGEEDALSRLFHTVYGYRYINEVVYYPDKLRAMLAEGELLSIVAARPNGRLVGHVGLVRKNKAPTVYEAAMGIVDPAVKSRGLFGLLFEKTMETIRETSMQYCFLDFVTNHDYTQKHLLRYGTRDLALFVGCQSRQTQARLEKLGIGPDPQDMDRYSLLTSLIPRVRHPFGREVLLPESLGSSFGFLLKPLGLRWAHTPRFQTLPERGSCKTDCQSAQASVLFDLSEPGREALEQISAQWREFLRNGFQYAAVEIPLDAPGLGPAYEMLSANGFFPAGFAPYHFSDRLAFRFQALGPTRVAFDKIKVVSEGARKLLDAVRNEYEAACLI
ncbi:MAG: hypothetical protein HY551_07620 [Elusimicrobia bacterium]|nr:hypothetical protein [Elusimicrobiota bacterium]